MQDPACPARGGFVCVSAADGRFILRAAENEPYLLAHVAVAADVDTPGQVWIATLPLADLLTKRPAAAAELEVTADPTRGRVQVIFRAAGGQTIRVRQASAMAVTEDNALRSITPAPRDAVFSTPLTPDLVTSLAGQVRQHDTFIGDRPRTVWLTLEDTQVRLEAWISDGEATAVDFPLTVAPVATEQVSECLGVLLGRAVARIGKVIDKVSGVMEIRTMLSNTVERQCLLLRADPYEFVLPLAEDIDEGVPLKIHHLRHCLASNTTVSVEVDGEDGLISQVCHESTGALRHPRAVLDFYDRGGQQMLLVHLTDESTTETAAAEIYSGEFPVVMSAPLNRRMVLDHKRLAAALAVFRRHARIRLHADPVGGQQEWLLGITSATENGGPVSEFQAGDIRTVLVILRKSPIRLAPFDDTGPIPRL